MLTKIKAMNAMQWQRLEFSVLTCLSLWGQHVHDAVVGVHDAQLDDQERLLEDVAPSEAWHPLIPDTAQELLHIGVGNK